MIQAQNKKLFRLVIILSSILAILLGLQYYYFKSDFGMGRVRIVTQSPSSAQDNYKFTADSSLYHFSSHEGKMETRSNFFSSEFLQNFPYKIGPWEGKDIENHYADISLFRLYRNKDTQDVLWLILVHGSHPSQFHSAEVCYLSDGWDVAERDIKKIKMNEDEFPIRYMVAQKNDMAHLVSSWYMWPTPKRNILDGALLFRISVELTQSEEQGQKALLNFIENMSNLVMEEAPSKTSSPGLTGGSMDSRFRGNDLTVIPPLIEKAKTEQVNSSFHQAKEKALQWILNQRVPNQVVPFPEMDRRYLLLSYELNNKHPQTQNDKSYPYIFSRSAIYDDALGLIALTMTGHRKEAQDLIDAFERIVRDSGELWFGYNTHNEWPSENDYSESMTRSGASSWVGYAITYYMRQTNSHNKRYLSLAKKIADKLLKDQILDPKDPRSGLVTGGKGTYDLVWDATQKKVIEKFRDVKIEWTSMEHNLDLYFFLKNLAFLTHEEKYEKAKEALKSSLETKAWNDAEGQFNRGVRLNGADSSMALDCASWGLLFLLSLGEQTKAEAAMKAMERYKILDPLRQITGYRPYYKSLIYDELSINQLFYPHHPSKNWGEVQMVWSEGSLGVAMAYLKLGKMEEAKSILRQMIKMQTASGGLQYATEEIPFQFSTTPSMAGTAWLVIVLEALENPQALQLFWN